MYQINLSNTSIEVREDNYEKGEIRSFQKDMMVRQFLILKLIKN